MDLRNAAFFIALVFLIAILVVPFLIYVSTFSGGKGIADGFANSSSVSLSYDLADCKAGDAGSFRISESASIDLKVAGIISHKGRDACHSSGKLTQDGKTFEIDIYRVAEGDECIALLSLSNPEDYGESCYGIWPGST